MKITMDNMLKNWKVLLFLIILMKLIVLLLYKALGVEEIFGMEFYQASTFLSIPAFLLYLHFKSEEN